MAQGRSTKIISMMKWIRISRLSIKKSLSLGSVWKSELSPACGCEPSSFRERETSLLPTNWPGCATSRHTPVRARQVPPHAFLPVRLRSCRSVTAPVTRSIPRHTTYCSGSRNPQSSPDNRLRQQVTSQQVTSPCQRWGGREMSFSNTGGRSCVAPWLSRTGRRALCGITDVERLCNTHDSQLCPLSSFPRGDRGSIVRGQARNLLSPSLPLSQTGRGALFGMADVERLWNMHDSQGQILALASRPDSNLGFHFEVHKKNSAVPSLLHINT